VKRKDTDEEEILIEATILRRKKIKSRSYSKKNYAVIPKPPPPSGGGSRGRIFLNPIEPGLGEGSPFLRGPGRAVALPLVRL
jgi:hypothetical protein